MRRRLDALVILFVVALLFATGEAAAQQAQFDEVTVALHRDRMDAALRGAEVTGDDASALRTVIDRDHGDDDGLVTDSEIKAYVSAEMAKHNEQLKRYAPTLTRGILIEGRQPQTVEVTAILLTDARGAVTSNTTIGQDFDAVLDFANSTQDRVNHSFVQDFRHALPGLHFTTARFVTEEPWAIDEATINGGAGSPFFSDGAFVVTYSEIPDFANEDAPLWFDVIDTSAIRPTDDGDDQDSPAPGALWPTLVVVAALALTRHRVRRM